uniref:Uncharacterized protein n=1 Tax=Babesia bovis TaxID=5865 RepID=S6BHS1_BABBO|nr:hypothetical protein [Babesia bovis]
MTVPSLLPLATYVPQGDNLISHTSSKWPCRRAMHLVCIRNEAQEWSSYKFITALRDHEKWFLQYNSCNSTAW